MKKVLVVLALLAPFAVMMAVEVIPTVIVETPISFKDNELNMPEEIELKYDEATPLGWSLRLSAGDRLAVKFTPPSYPFDITQAAFSVWDDGYDQEIKLVFYRDGASPGSEMDSKNATADAAQTFYWVDVSDLNLDAIASGSFYCAVELLVTTYPYFIYDEGEPLHHRSWFYPTSAEQWYAWENVNVIDSETGDTLVLGDEADMMIRVKGNASGIGEVELRPGGVVIMPSATIVASEGSVNYTLPSAGAVDITLWDAAGRHVETLYTGHSDAGEHTIAWDALNLASGTYFIRLNALNTVRVAKLVLVN